MNSDIFTRRDNIRQPQAATVPAGLEDDAALDEPVPVDLEGPDTDYEPPKQRHLSWRRAGGLAAIVFGVALGVLLVIHNAASQHQAALQSQLSSGSARVKSQTLALPDLSQELLSKSQPSSNDTLTVNGQVKVNSSLVLQPTVQPTNPVSGELYYDLSRAQLDYYNGKQFVAVTSGGNTTINNFTSGATTNVTNVTNINGGSGNLSGNGGNAGSIAMFSNNNTLTNSLITQNGNNLDTGNLVESVTIGSTNGASATTLQGGLTGLSLLTGNQTGTTGGIVIQSGDSTTTAAGNISIDTGASVLSGTVVANKTFESGIDNMGDAVFGDNTVITQTNAQAHGGTHSLAIAVGSNFFPHWAIGDGVGNPPLIIPVTQGHTYAFSAWVRADTNSDNITGSVVWSNDGYGGGGLISQQDFGTVTDITTGWRKVNGILTAPAGAVAVGFVFESFNAQSAGEVHYFDDMTVTDLSSSGSAAAISLGTANAQLITIGNSAMLAPTTIYGGGINLYGGTGFMNLSAGNITATSGGATYATTTGALDITAATSSTWKIAGSGGTGGSLSIQAGNAGANSNGGDLDLQSGAGAGSGVAGSVTIDSQLSAVSGTIVDNRGFETGTQDLNAWFGDTVAQSSTAVHSGGFSLAVTPAGGNWGVIQDENQPAIPIVAGHKYFFSAYVRADSVPETVSAKIDFANSANTIIATDNVNSVTSSGTVWEQISGTLTAPATSTKAYWKFNGSGASGDTQYLDDLVTTDLSASTDTSNLNLGNSFAQVVNIGNMNEIGPTTIQGGSGITIDSGQSDLNISGGAVTISGVATAIKPPADSTTAFEVQNASGTPLLTADTTDMVLTVQALAVSATLTINGHIVSGGSTPGITAGAAACTAPSLSVSGTDTSGTITVTTGTGCATNGTLGTVTFTGPFGSAPHVSLTPGGSNSLTLGAYVDDSSITGNSFAIGTNTTPNSSTTYKWNYLVIQ